MSFRSFLGNKYHPLNSIELSRSALINNFSYLAKIDKELNIVPVLKSNAYGHGLIQVAKALDKLNAAYFCVDSLYEAYELLNHNIKTPVLILGYVDPENLKIKKLPFSYAVSSMDMIEAISKYQSHAGIHIFVDTGMSREGIRIEELATFLDYIKSFGNMRVDGLMSHLAASEKFDNSKTTRQVKNFKKAQLICSTAGIFPKWVHLGNSSAVLNYRKYKKKIGNLARCGIAIYGIDPEKVNTKLQPALEFKTKINQVKNILKGEGIGYNFTYIAKKKMTIGVLPVGYFDGVDRRLSNSGFVTVNNQLCPVIGRVSMNITLIDLSNIKSPSVGDSVVVYSNKIKEKNSILSASRLCQTIPYDLLVGLASTTKRSVLN
ncbi:MAG TPA: alanine racemase [Candidatus Limnocylindrales bacterium]|nr:alanine racemase [Candidatus Limnocylindrales bacterium]